MKKKLLIVANGRWQEPLILKAKARENLILIGADGYKNPYSKKWLAYSEQVDIRKEKEVLRIAEKYNIDGVVTDQTDVSVPSVAYVAEKFNLPGIGYQNSLIATNKFLMRNFVSQIEGVKQPWFYKVKKREELKELNLTFPCVIKPVDSQSSRGVFLVSSYEELREKFALSLSFCFREKAILIEEYIRGVESTVEGIIIKRVPQVLAISEKEHYANNPNVAKRLSYAPTFSGEILKKLKETTQIILKALGIECSIFHFEYKVYENEVFLIEFALRGGGSLIPSHILPYMTGVDVEEILLDYVLKDKDYFKKFKITKDRIASLEFFDIPPGKLVEIEGLEEVKKVDGLLAFILEVEKGAEIPKSFDDRGRPGFFIIGAKNREKLKEKISLIRRKVKFIVR